MILTGACCADCANKGMSGWTDYLNPITAAKKIGNQLVDAIGSVAGNVADEVDSFAKKTLSTTLTSGAAARQLLSSPGGGTAAPSVSYTPLAVGGLAAAGLLLWALMPSKKKKEHHT